MTSQYILISSVISGLLIMIYLSVCTSMTNKLPVSLSYTFYQLEEVKSGLGTLFTFLCESLVFLMMPVVFEVSNNSSQMIVAFTMFTSLAVIGVTPLFLGHHKYVHYTSAVILGVSNQIWLILNSGSAIPVAITAFFTAMLILVSKCSKRVILYLEISMLYVTLVYLIRKFT